MLHGHPGYHWTPARRGGAPLHYARCCKCVWCRGIRSALQTELAPCPHTGDAGSLSLTPGAPSAPAGQHWAKEESTPAAWSLSPSCAAQEERRLVKRLPTTMQHTQTDIYLSFYTPNILPTPCLLFSFLVPLLSPALPLPLPPPTYTPHAEEQVRTAPRSFFVSLSSSNSCFSLFPLWVLVKYMVLALLALRMLLLQVVCSTAPWALCTHNLNFILSQRHSFSIPFFVSNSCSILPSWERGVVSMALLSPTPAALNHPFINS